LISIKWHNSWIVDYWAKSSIKREDLKLDILLVMGSTYAEYTAEKTAKLFKNTKIKPLIIATGKGTKKIAEGQAMKTLLIEKGVPAEYILLEDKSMGTGENISFAYDNFQKELQSESISLNPKLVDRLRQNKKFNVAMIQYSSMLFRHYNIDEDVNNWKNSSIGKKSGWVFYPFPSDDSVIEDLKFADQVGFIARLGSELSRRDENQIPSNISVLIDFFRGFFTAFENKRIDDVFDYINQKILTINIGLESLKSA